MLNSVIIKRYKPYTVKAITGDSYVKGKRSKTYASSTVNLTIIPIKLKDIKDAPEGVWDMGDVKIYVAGTLDIPAKSVVTFNGDDYNIKALVNRQYGAFSIYQGKVLKK